MEDGRRRGRQRQCWMDNVKEWTSLPIRELLTTASRRKDRKGIPAESSVMSLRRTNRSRDWTEIFCSDFVQEQTVSLDRGCSVDYREICSGEFVCLLACLLLLFFYFVSNNFHFCSNLNTEGDNIRWLSWLIKQRNIGRHQGLPQWL